MSETTCNWGANGGKCTDCFVCEPCCGQPCNVAQGCYCFWCLYCCGYCVLAKLWAYSQDKPCGFLNHFFIIFAIIFACIFVGEGLTALFVSLQIPYLIPIPMVLMMIPALVIFIMRLATRVSLRRKFKIGSGRVDIFDILLLCFCSSCELCQEMRSAGEEGWDWFGQLRKEGCFCNTGFQLCRPVDFNYTPNGKDFDLNEDKLGTDDSVNSYPPPMMDSSEYQL